MHPLTTDLAEQILALVRIEAYSLLGAIQDNKVVLGGSAGSGGGTGEPPAGFVGQLTQSNVTFDTAGSSRACSAGSAGSSSLVDNLDAIRLGLEICDDAIGERHIDWGTGAGQVSAVDVPFATTSGSIDATNVRDAIEETYTEGGCAFEAGAPDAITPDQTGSAGISTYPARKDHAHAITCAAPDVNLSVSSTNAEGTGSDFARNNHSHAIDTSSNPGNAASILATDASGYLQLERLGIQDTPTGAKAQFKQANITGAIPVQILEQRDVDKPFTRFIGTAGSADLTRSIVDNDDVSTATLAGWLMQEVVDFGNQIADQIYFSPIYTLT